MFRPHLIKCHSPMILKGKSTHTTWSKVCGHLAVAPICEPSPNCFHKVRSRKLYRMSLYRLQVTCTGSELTSALEVLLRFLGQQSGYKIWNEMFNCHVHAHHTCFTFISQHTLWTAAPLKYCQRHTEHRQGHSQHSLSDKKTIYTDTNLYYTSYDPLHDALPLSRLQKY